MSLPEEADRRIVGPFGVVEFAVASEERMGEAWRWWVKADKKVKMALQATMQRLVDKGEIHNETLFKQLEGAIWEFKRGSDRMLCYRKSDCCLLTNTLTKGGRKDISEDIKKANKIGERHLEWEASRIP